MNKIPKISQLILKSLKKDFFKWSKKIFRSITAIQNMGAANIYIGCTKIYNMVGMSLRMSQCDLVVLRRGH